MRYKRNRELLVGYPRLRHHKTVLESFGPFVGFHKTSVDIRQYSNTITIHLTILQEILRTFKSKTYQNHWTTLKHFGQPTYVTPARHTRWVHHSDNNLIIIERQTLERSSKKKEKGTTNNLPHPQEKLY